MSLFLLSRLFFSYPSHQNRNETINTQYNIDIPILCLRPLPWISWYESAILRNDQKQVFITFPCYSYARTTSWVLFSWVIVTFKPFTVIVGSCCSFPNCPQFSLVLLFNWLLRSSSTSRLLLLMLPFNHSTHVINNSHYNYPYLA